jgi:hypothetical protein
VSVIGSLAMPSLSAGCGALQDAQIAGENDCIESARGVGETIDFGDIAARWPLAWQGNDVVVFLTWVGLATLDLRNGTVTHHKDESLMAPKPLPAPVVDLLPADGNYGPWESHGDPRRLRVGDANSCAQFLVSHPLRAPRQPAVAAAPAAVQPLTLAACLDHSAKGGG